MIDPNDIPLPAGLGAWGTVIGMVVGGAIFMRRFFSKDALGRADDSGQMHSIDTLKQILAEERTARHVAEKRADEFAKERNEAWQLLGDLKGQLSSMVQTIKTQTGELSELRDQVRQLREQLDGKN